MSLIACGSTHQGHERFILVMTLEEDEIFMCLAALLCEQFFANGDVKILIKFQDDHFFSVHSVNSQIYVIKTSHFHFYWHRLGIKANF